MSGVAPLGPALPPEALAGVSVFRGIGPAWLRRLAFGARPLRLVDGAQVFAQGGAADCVYAVLPGEAGRVRIGATEADGKRLLVEVFGPDEIFGELGVLTGAPRNATAVAEGHVRLARLRAEDFLAALREEPALGAALALLLARRLQRTSTLFQGAAFATLEVRLACQVLHLARRGGARRAQDGSLRLVGRFRQRDIADLVGATTRSVITILNAWRAERVVDYDGARALLTVLDEARLRALAGETALGEGRGGGA